MSSKPAVAVAGAGLAGLLSAAALAQTGCAVTVFDSSRRSPERFPRMFTLNRAALDLLDGLGALERLPVNEVRNMRVFGCDGSELHIGAPSLGVARLCVTVAEADLHAVAVRTAQDSAVDVRGGRPFRGLSHHDGVLRADFGAQTVECSLLVGADGAGSAVAAAAGLRQKRRSFGQVALTGIARAQRPCLGTAWQWLDSRGLLALLPAGRDKVSYIWSLQTKRAQKLGELSCAQFADRLADASARALGELSVGKRPVAYELAQSERAATAARVVLVGDSLRAVHPLAGQGLCASLGDALMLARCVAGGSDPGAAACLRRYSRLRRLRSAATLAVTSSFAQIVGGGSSCAVPLFRAVSRWPSSALLGLAVICANLP